MSNLVIEATQDVTSGAGFTLGHQQMFAAWLALSLENNTKMNLRYYVAWC